MSWFKFWVKYCQIPKDGVFHRCPFISPSDVNDAFAKCLKISVKQNLHLRARCGDSPPGLISLVAMVSHHCVKKFYPTFVTLDQTLGTHWHMSVAYWSHRCVCWSHPATFWRQPASDRADPDLRGGAGQKRVSGAGARVPGSLCCWPCGLSSQWVGILCQTVSGWFKPETNRQIDNQILSVPTFWHWNLYGRHLCRWCSVCCFRLL